MNMSATNTRMNRRLRRGFTLLETTVAASVLAVVISLTARLLVRLKTADVVADERREALDAAENALERASAAVIRTGQVPAEMSTLTTLERPDEATLRIVIGASDDLGLSPVTATVAWTSSQGRRAEPVSLTTWLPLKPEETRP
jgi:prepilin-type N-terminal cleavage/methylation domain-containing protein